MRRPALRIAALLAAILCASLCSRLALAPAPAEPVAWQPSASAGYAGAYAQNTRLAGLQRIALARAAPEHVALGPDGWLYAAVEGALILRMRPDGSAQETWARSGGRVLGFDWLPDGRLVAADALRGLVAFDAAAPTVAGAARVWPRARLYRSRHRRRRPAGPVRRLSGHHGRVGNGRPLTHPERAGARARLAARARLCESMHARCGACYRRGQWQSAFPLSAGRFFAA